mmetsp:Transcript_4820/g.21496  ORF Transcript_4820/g.21496 Transcript_4820/m.21496 type:complete len:504 (-) Transcript_4820:1368-2879(-)
MRWTSARRLAAAAMNAAARGSRDPARGSGASLTLKPTSVSLAGSCARSDAHVASSLATRAASSSSADSSSIFVSRGDSAAAAIVACASGSSDPRSPYASARRFAAATTKVTCEGVFASNAIGAGTRLVPLQNGDPSLCVCAGGKFFNIALGRRVKHSRNRAAAQRTQCEYSYGRSRTRPACIRRRSRSLEPKSRLELDASRFSSAYVESRRYALTPRGASTNKSTKRSFAHRAACTHACGKLPSTQLGGSHSGASRGPCDQGIVRWGTATWHDTASPSQPASRSAHRVRQLSSSIALRSASESTHDTIASTPSRRVASYLAVPSPLPSHAMCEVHVSSPGWPASSDASRDLSGDTATPPGEPTASSGAEDPSVLATVASSTRAWFTRAAHSCATAATLAAALFAPASPALNRLPLARSCLKTSAASTTSTRPPPHFPTPASANSLNTSRPMPPPPAIVTRIDPSTSTASDPRRIRAPSVPGGATTRDETFAFCEIGTIISTQS